MLKIRLNKGYNNFVSQFCRDWPRAEGYSIDTKMAKLLEDGFNFKKIDDDNYHISAYFVNIKPFMTYANTQVFVENNSYGFKSFGLSSGRQAPALEISFNRVRKEEGFVHENISIRDVIFSNMQEYRFGNNKFFNDFPNAKEFASFLSGPNKSFGEDSQAITHGINVLSNKVARQYLVENNIDFVEGKMKHGNAKSKFRINKPLTDKLSFCNQFAFFFPDKAHLLKYYINNNKILKPRPGESINLNMFKPVTETGNILDKVAKIKVYNASILQDLDKKGVTCKELITEVAEKYKLRISESVNRPLMAPSMSCTLKITDINVGKTFSVSKNYKDDSVIELCYKKAVSQLREFYLKNSKSTGILG